MASEVRLRLALPGRHRGFVHAADHFADVTDDQKMAVQDTLMQLELERGERIKQAKTQATDGAGK